jgi:sugar lactone lactonase YvrE
MRRIVLMLVLALAVAVPVALAKGPRPETIPLPAGFQPEGIAIAGGNTFVVGSIPTGAVYRGDLRTGAGSILVPGATGRAATGLEVHHGRLFVSGAGTGKAFVYDAGTGSLLHEYQLATGAGATFVNDVVVTRQAAYFTDSSRPVLYRIALGKGFEPAASAQTIALTGDYQHVAGAFNLNGIDATPNGKTLVAVQSVTGKLFTIDPATGATRQIDLGGVALTNGDGILLQGDRLYVVQNQDNRIAVVKLRDGLTHGTVERVITDPRFDVPTTIARKGSRLYAVNARFTTPPTPSTTYDVVEVRR